jgi:P-type Ca2+ transporter type 2C
VGERNNWHQLDHERVGSELKSSSQGIARDEAVRRLAEYGHNEIEDARKKSVFRMILWQFTDLMILILAIAAVISGLLGDVTDTVVILVIIILNAAIGFVQEFKAEKAMNALRSMAAGNSTVIREGKSEIIPSRELVPGDVVVLEAGNVIPADIRLFDAHRLKTDESALTGESVNVDKATHPLEGDELPLGDRVNMGFKGTSVAHGRSSGYIVATGMRTELGKIAALVAREEKPTPLQRRLSEFSKRLSVIVLAICALFFFVGWLRGEAIVNLLLVSISLAVAAIPEALPALVTVGLALGARRMARSNALVRKLHAVESLGSVTHICSDKTGTLTMNQMTVQEIFELKEHGLSFPGDKNALFMSMALNNDVGKDREGKVTGDSTEVALMEYARENGHEKAALITDFPRIAELPFDSERKLMSTFHRVGERCLLITKGAVDSLVNLLEEDSAQRKAEIETESEKLAARGYRVLGFGAKWIDSIPDPKELAETERSLTFIGLAGIADPPRTEAAEAVRQCREAGMRAIMITGDHKLTAAAIAKQLGMLDTKKAKVINGVELADMSEEEFFDEVENIVVYARVNPEQKLNIINALQQKGHLVAMTGDGVNDAPALKAADIGVAMGVNGTEVAREASDMILLDDNFATIVKAVKHGRRIFDNITKFIKYIMTGNTGELWAILLAPFFGLPIPLIPIQILWVNLVTDGLPGLALASEPAEPHVMRRPPYPPSRSIFAGGLGVHIIWVGFLIGILTLGTFAWGFHYNVASRQTMAFTVLCFCQLSHVAAIRSAQSFWRSRPFSNMPMVYALLLTLLLQLAIIYIPVFGRIFKTHPLTFAELAACVGISAIVFFAVEAEKWFQKRIGSR